MWFSHVDHSFLPANIPRTNGIPIAQSISIGVYQGKGSHFAILPTLSKATPVIKEIHATPINNSRFIFILAPSKASLIRRDIRASSLLNTFRWPLCPFPSAPVRRIPCLLSFQQNGSGCFSPGYNLGLSGHVNVLSWIRLSYFLSPIWFPASRVTAEHRLIVRRATCDSLVMADTTFWRSVRITPKFPSLRCLSGQDSHEPRCDCRHNC